MKGWTLWLIGLPASGKTTLAHALSYELHKQGISAVVLDSDELRRILTPTPTYSEAERDDFYQALVQIAVLLNDFGVNAIIAATAPRRAYRDSARQTLARFAEIWVRCPLSVCEQRDPKGLYRRARAGMIVRLPGIGTLYEEPRNASVIVDSAQMTIPAMVSHILKALPWLTPPP